MKTTRVHYQHGSIRREARKHSPAVWVFRWREDTPTGRIKRKEIIGTLEKYKTKASAIKACESLRSNINRETRVPRTFGELVAHYRENELPRNKTPYTVEVYEGYLKTWLLPEWKEHRLSNIHAVSVESWLENLPLAHGTRAKLRNLMHVIFNHGKRCRFTSGEPDYARTAVGKTWTCSRCFDRGGIDKTAVRIEGALENGDIRCLNYWVEGVRTPGAEVAGL